MKPEPDVSPHAEHFQSMKHTLSLRITQIRTCNVKTGLTRIRFLVDKNSTAMALILIITLIIVGNYQPTCWKMLGRAFNLASLWIWVVN